MKKLIFGLMCAVMLGQGTEVPKVPDKITVAQANYYLALKTYVETYASAPNVTCTELADAALSASSSFIADYQKALTEKFVLPIDKLESIRNDIEKTGYRFAIQIAGSNPTSYPKSPVKSGAFGKAAGKRLEPLPCLDCGLPGVPCGSLHRASESPPSFRGQLHIPQPPIQKSRRRSSGCHRPACPQP